MIKKKNYNKHKQVLQNLSIQDKRFRQLYEEHRNRVRNAESKTDDKPPILNARMFYKPNKLEEETAQVQRMTTENKKLLKKINIINRTMGRVNSHWDRKFKTETNYKVRELEMKMITLQNDTILERILNQGPLVIDNKTLMKDWKENMKKMELMSHFPLICKLEKPDELLPQGTHMLKSYTVNVKKSGITKKRPRCFLNIGIENGIQLGVMIIELYDDYVPETAGNFLSICKGTDDGLTYKNCPFHRIIRGLLCEGGDITKFNGSGGMSIYGEVFPDENFLLQHGAPGVLSMINTGHDSNNSQFNITFKRLLSLNGKNVVFGRVIKGLDTLFRIQEYGTKSGKPLAKVMINDCGQYYKKI